MCMSTSSMGLYFLFSELHEYRSLLCSYLLFNVSGRLQTFESIILRMKQILSILVALFCITLSAQQKNLNPIDEAVVNLYSQLLVYPQEKIYVQTDKPYYISGEKLFFRAFLLHASKLTQASMSRYVYVELLSPIDSVVSRSRVRLDADNLFYGHVGLPELLPEGTYRLRAYTRYMTSQDESFFYSRPVYVADPKSAGTVVEPVFNFSPKGTVEVRLTLKDKKTNAKLVPEMVELNYGRKLASKIVMPDENGVVSDMITVKDIDASRKMLVRFRVGANAFHGYLSIPYSDSSPDLQFYPEGGRLIPHSKNRVAFKALLPGGNAADVKGTVFDSHNEIQAQFATTRDGMGSFEFTPKVGETYTARYTYGGAQYDAKIPDAEIRANSLRLTTHNDSVSLALLSATSDDNQIFYLLVHRQGVPVYFKTWSNVKALLKWSVAWFPAGVSHFVLLDKELNILSERMYFSNRHDELNTEISADKKIFRPREKVSLAFRMPAAVADTVPVSLAVSVTDDKDVMLDTTTNIISEILLTSELAGTVNNPAWYFEQAEGREAAADLLMLTHGWRKYHVAEALQGKFQKPAVKPEVSQTISGTLKRLNGKAYAKGIVQVSAVGYDYKEAIEADDDGRFEFENFEFPENTAYQLLANTPERKTDIEIWADEEKYPETSAHALRDLYKSNVESGKLPLADYVNKATRKYMMENGILSIDLEELTVKAFVRKKRERLENQIVPTKGDRWVSPTELKENPPATFEDLFNRLPGVQEVSADGVRFTNGAAKFIVNGIERNYIDLPALINVSDVAQLDAYTSNMAVMMRWQPPTPVIIITTWPSSTWSKLTTNSSNVRLVLPLGYQKPVEFYSPRYDTPEAMNDEKPDMRSTIFWKPNVKLDKDKATKFDFFTADSPTSYSVVVEGVGQGRKLIYSRQKALLKVE